MLGAYSFSVLKICCVSDINFRSLRKWKLFLHVIIKTTKKNSLLINVVFMKKAAAKARALHEHREWSTKIQNKSTPFAYLVYFRWEWPFGTVVAVVVFSASKTNRRAPCVWIKQNVSFVLVQWDRKITRVETICQRRYKRMKMTLNFSSFRSRFERNTRAHCEQFRQQKMDY